MKISNDGKESEPTAAIPVRRRFNSFFDGTMKRPSIFNLDKTVQSELPDSADKGLKEYINYEYPDITKEVLLAMVTPTLGINAEFYERRVPFTDNSLNIKIWNTILTATSLFETIFTPLITAFPDARSLFIQNLQLLTSLCFVFDMFLSFLKSYKGKNGLNESRLTKVIEHYVLGYFPLDVLCLISRIIPYEYEEYVFDSSHLSYPSFKAIFKNLVIVQGIKNFNSRNHLAKSKNLNRSSYWICRLLLMFLIFVHLYAILLFYTSQTTESTFHNLNPRNNNSHWFTRYTEYFVASFYILAGKNVVLTTTSEKWFGILGSVIGILGQAYLLGEVTLLLQKINARRTKWRLALEELDGSMGNMKLSSTLRKRVKNAFAYWWAINGNQSTKNEWLEIISPELRTEVYLQINKQLLLNVPLFKDGSDAFLIAITEVLQTELYLPGGYVIVYDAHGTDMFFIVYGTLQALNKLETTVYSIMNPGMFFGEIAMLYPEMRRTATVRSFTYSQLSKLSIIDLQRTLEKLPDKHNNELKGLRDTAHERLQNTKKIETFSAKFQQKKSRT